MRPVGISIHLMLLFITGTATIDGSESVFQYISCYCLSTPIDAICFMDADFNTSHVTVYRKTSDGEELEDASFQYISCYCLSLCNIQDFHCFALFQYISCYCLSDCSVFFFIDSIISIHLMLLFILRRYITI